MIISTAKSFLYRRAFLIPIVLIIMMSNLFATDDEWEGKRAPEFELKNINTKETHRLSQYLGKIVIVDFWATWCAPCKKSLPKLAQIEKKYSKDIQVLTISIDDDEENARRFIEEYKIDLIALYDEGKKVVSIFDISGMPTLFIIDQKGVIQSSFEGYTEDSFDDVVEEINKLK
jgi:thiol-disulfide isomerase/thioredoxin